MSNNNNNYSFEILSDTVSDRDLFEHKTHEKSADVLYEVVKKSQNMDITIGLEGVWGSGKSTVINMFKNKVMQDNKDVLFFMFDTWAHKDDPLRKIFLESLIQDLKSKNQEIKPGLDKIHKEILGKVKTIDITAHKTVSPLGKYLAFSAFLIPLGTAILKYWESHLSVLIIGSLLISAPLLVLLYWMIWGDEIIIEQNSTKSIRKKNWDFFTKESTETIRQDINEQGEKTSIEFQQLFERIINSAKTEYGIKHIIIVIDNLDRVDPEQAKSVWSTLQTFFQSRSLSDQPNVVKHIVQFIVPYDKKGFASIWDKENEDSESAISFLDKCFQVRVEIPQPIMSGWLSYCQNAMEKALIGWGENDKNSILAEYSRIISNKNLTPTPRNMRAWINQVAINGFKWQGAFTPKSIAVYSYLRLQYDEQKIKQFLLENEQAKLLVDDVETTYELAGQLFGVRKEVGTELLLKDSIKLAIQEAKDSTIKSLIEAHKQVFWLTWENNFREFIDNNSDFKSRAIVDLTNYINRELEGNPGKLQNFNQALLLKWHEIKTDEWVLNDEFHYSDTLALVISSLGDNQQFNWLNNSLRALSKQFLGNLDNIKNNDPMREYRGLIDLAKNSLNFKVSNYFVFEDKNEWSKWLSLQQKFTTIFKEFLPSKEAFQKWITEIFSNPNALDKEGLQLLINSLPYLEEVSYWASANTELQKFFQKDVNSRERNNDLVYELTFALLVKFNFLEVQKILKENPYYNQVLQNEDIEQVPSLNFLTALIFKSELQKHTANVKTENKTFWSTASEENINKTMTFLKKYNALFLIAILAQDLTNKQALEILLKKSEAALFDQKSQAIYYLNSYTKDMKDEDEIHNFVNKVLIHSPINPTVQDDFESSPVQFSPVMLLILQQGDETNRDRVIYIISKITKETWIKNLDDQKELLKLIKNPVKLDHIFSDAFYYWFGKMLENEDKEQFIVWQTIMNNHDYVMDRHTKLAQYLNPYFSYTRDNLSEEGFDFVSNYWKDSSNLNMEDAIKRIELWLDNKKINRLEWLLNAGFKPDSQTYETLNSKVQTLIKEYEKSDEVMPELATLKKMKKLFQR